jgi:hypothetical protein
MKRFFYRVLIGLHPEHFREQSGEEMLWIFDESSQDGTLRFFSDCLLSLLRQWFLRSGLWKLGAGAVVSALFLSVRGYYLASSTKASPDPRTPVDMAAFSRSAAQAVAFLARFRKEEMQKRHSQRHVPSHFDPPTDNRGNEN